MSEVVRSAEVLERILTSSKPLRELTEKKDQGQMNAWIEGTQIAANLATAAGVVGLFILAIANVADGPSRGHPA